MNAKQTIITPLEVQHVLQDAGWEDVNRSTIQRWCINGKLKAQKWEGKWFINRLHFEEEVLKPMVKVFEEVGSQTH